MLAGMSGKFNILERSPHDSNTSEGHVATLGAGKQWVASRYAIRATTEDDRLILWHTFSGAMIAIQPDQVDRVKKLLVRKPFTAPREGLVGYLADRGFLVEDGSHEYRQVQVAIHQQQYRTDRLEFILLASEDCNFRCKYCYENFARGTMLPSVREGIKNLVRKRLPTLASLQVSWFGGEPLYGMEAIDDLAPFFVQTAEENDLLYNSGMTTNGYLLTPDVAEKLLAWNIRKFQITVDGVPEDHDCNRPTRDGHGTFDRIFSNLIALGQRDDDFSVTIRVNFDRENYPRLGEFIDRVEQNFAHDSRFSARFFPVGKWGGDNDEKLDVCGDDADDIEAQLRAQARKRGIKVGTLKGMRLGNEVCYAARPYNLLVGASGKIMKCTILLDADESNVVGFLDQDGEVHLNHDRMALWTEPAFENDTKCQKCVVLPLCQGTHCPLVRMQQGRSPCTPLRKEGKQRLLETFEATGRTKLTPTTLASASNAAGG